ncbi:hypothetical protein [Niveibacterium microcysteis]|uniref:Tyr recombinase domain-containing protein n=1 Tax=Niveibacterium microcysteis TaxID=2811415 RepID=A0ABX7M101_9RHOO|nr:hypothetical protein [Niveibacterium microcysteis]QSI75447.1 hypothetical protein JY500_13110 [Niveibacterium microcysteis]
MSSFAGAAMRGAGVFSAPPALGPDLQVRRSRRWRVFGAVFIACSVLGLIYDFSRPAEYRAEARVQITPAASLPPVSSSQQPSNAAPPPAPGLADEVQRLTGRPLIERVRDQLHRAGVEMDGLESADAIQRILSAEAVADSRIVELSAVGRHPDALARLVNGLIGVYRDEIAEQFQKTAAQTLTQSREELDRLSARIAEKRAAVEAFQAQHNIVSANHQENALLSGVKDMSTSLNVANDRVVAAEARLRSLRESAAAGKSIERARDNPTLASIEQRASQTREALRDMERNYTADYMAIDPNARALRARLAELEAQLKAQRSASRDASIAEAQEELATAQEAANRLRQQMAGARGVVQSFAIRVSEYKAMQDELDQLEALHRSSLERLVKLEASERARMPSLSVIEWASTPHDTWRPRYARDAAIVLAAALLAALFAVWLVDYLQSRGPQPAVVVSPVWLGGGASAVQIGPNAQPPQLQAARPDLLPAPLALPRELSDSESSALLAAASGASRVALRCLFAGVDPSELLILRAGDVDLEQAALRVGGASQRRIGLTADALADLRSEAPDQPLLRNAAGAPLDRAALDSLLLCLAHDAGVQAPAEVTADALRHSYLSHLARQGVRFSDLALRVGAVPAERLAAYSAMAPTGQRLAAEQVDWFYPPVH